ncbi:lycopene cyclase domain-containing protein [Nakamurella sp.]|uniref:lycopene cyclase domain-containing protein n=1 Tax=Nakamurella sp. TaxID=1869182 RepID=UPI003B3B8145
MIGAYTAGALVAIVVAVLMDLVVVRTGLLRTRLFWASYAIVVFFQLIVNGILTGLGIVQYDPDVILGIRLAYAPIEDLGFGFGLVTLTLVAWTRLGRTAAAGRDEREAA